MNIPQHSSDAIMDPARCLQCYIARTNNFRPSDKQPLFIALNPPYRALASDTKAGILEDPIAKAGIKHIGFSAESFRPTGATLAIKTGVIPETAMQVGRSESPKLYLFIGQTFAPCFLRFVGHLWLLLLI